MRVWHMAQALSSDVTTLLDNSCSKHDEIQNLNGVLRCYYQLTWFHAGLEGKKCVHCDSYSPSMVASCSCPTKCLLQLCFVPQVEVRESPQPCLLMLTEYRPCVSSGQCHLDDADASAHTTDGTVYPPPLTAAFHMTRQTALEGGPDQLLQKHCNHTYSCKSMALQHQAPYSLNTSLSEFGLQLTYACLLCSADAWL